MKSTLMFFILGLSLTTAGNGFALQVYQNPHEGEPEDPKDEDESVNVSGNALVGYSFYNPSYGARPDNSGFALARYATHLDIDVPTNQNNWNLSFPIDANMFTDRLSSGLNILRPSELDLFGGITETHSFTKGSKFEIGIHAEEDRPLSSATSYETSACQPKCGFSQFDSDIRARYTYSLGGIFPKLKEDLSDGDIKGSFAVGYDWFNPSNPSRPDNSGRELFAYDMQTTFLVWHNRLGIKVQTTLLTDKWASNILSPTELDFTYGFVVKTNKFTTTVAYERDMPLDNNSLTQDFAYLTFTYDFDLHGISDHDE
jgi:hypothetical protein